MATAPAVPSLPSSSHDATRDAAPAPPQPPHWHPLAAPALAVAALLVFGLAVVQPDLAPSFAGAVRCAAAGASPCATTEAAGGGGGGGGFVPPWPLSPQPWYPWARPRAVASVLETRSSFALRHVIASMLAGLPVDVPIFVWHSDSNADMLAEAFGEWMALGKVRGFTLPHVSDGSTARDHSLLPSPAPPPPPPSMRRRARARAAWEHNEDLANVFYLNRSWLHALPLGVRFALVFATDSVVCDPDPDALWRYENYSYIGAPWRPGAEWDGPARVGLAGGNGGLSLRNVSAMERAFAAWAAAKGVDIDEDTPQRPNEDTWASEWTMAAGGTLPTREVALTFSVETQFFARPWGIHKGWAYMTGDPWRELLDWCGPAAPLISEGGPAWMRERGGWPAT